MKMASKNSRDTRIDILKFLCAFLVLFLHTANLGKPYTGIVENTLSDVLYFLVWSINPVEFFFIASAFLLFKKIVNAPDCNYDKRIKLYIQRLVVLYFFWSLFYLSAVFEPFLNVSSVKDVVISLIKIFRRLFLIGTSGHMWYVLSLIYGIMLLKPFLNDQTNNKIKTRIAWCISSILYVVSLLGDSYYHLLPDYCPLVTVLDMTRRALGSMYLLRGPLFIMIGYSLAHSKEVRSTRTNVLASFLLWVCLAVANNVELFLIKSLDTGLQYSITVLKPITSYAMWRFIRKLPALSLPYSSFLAKTSTVMYFIHIFLRDLLEPFSNDYFIVMISIFLFCLFISYVLVKLQKFDKFSWLKEVY